MRVDHGADYTDDGNVLRVPLGGASQELAMVRKKTLSPSGAKDDSGSYHNAHLNIHEDELIVAGMSIGEEIFVRVREDKIVIQKADGGEIEHDF